MEISYFNYYLSAHPYRKTKAGTGEKKEESSPSHSLRVARTISYIMLFHAVYLQILKSLYIFGVDGLWRQIMELPGSKHQGLQCGDTR